MEKSEDRKLIKKYIDTQGNTIDVFIDKAVTVTTPGGERVLTISPKGDLDIQDPEGKDLKANVFINRDLFIKELNEWKLATLTYENEDSQSWALSLYPQEQSLYEDADFLKIVNFYWKAWDKLSKLRPEEEQEEAKAHLDSVFPDYLKEALERSQPSKILNGIDEFAGIADIPADSEELEGQTNLFEEQAREYRTKRKSGADTPSSSGKIIVPSGKYRQALNYGELTVFIPAGITKFKPEVRFKDGYVYLEIGGERLGLAAIRDLQTKEGITEIDTTFLNFVYGEIFEDLQPSNFSTENEGTLIYRIADIVDRFGISSNFGGTTRQAVIRMASQYQNMAGWLVEGSRRIPSIWPVLLFKGYDSETDTIRVSSPYIHHLLKKQYEDSKKIDRKTGRVLLDKAGNAQTTPFVHTVIDEGLRKEKSLYAKLLAQDIVTLIKSAGKDREGRSKAHKKIIKFITDNGTILAKFNSFDSKRRQDEFYRNMFKTAFRYIEKYALRDLEAEYKDFKLPKLTIETPGKDGTIKTKTNFSLDDTLTFY